jgi:hypothetical protein
MREKYCSGWKNKLNKTDYKPDEQTLCVCWPLLGWFGADKFEVAILWGHRFWLRCDRQPVNQGLVVCLSCAGWITV